MTPPFQPGDRVKDIYNKPLGVLTVRSVDPMSNGNGYYCVCVGEGVVITVTDNSLKKVQDHDG